MKLLEKVHDPSSKGVFPRGLNTVYYNNQINYKNKTKIFSLLKEKLLIIPIVIYTRRNFFLNPTISKNIRLLQASGLIEHWHKTMVDKRFLKDKSRKGPKQLKMSHLESCFGILLIGHVMAFVSFVVENFKRLPNWMVKWIYGN